ncbi:MAG: hypothetical protein L3J74_03720, partial [Bacteroidales bacterium]|nr:hypothetical protein [Bacteroidales bacterium]
MKRNKRTKVIKQDSSTSSNIKIEKTNKKTNVFNLDKFLNIWTLTGLILLIGFFAFSKYLTGEYLFFFKDIGSDSINQNYPALVHKINLLKEGYFSKWSFYKGMGDAYVTGFPVEPYGVFRTIADYIGIKLSGINYLISGRFLRIFIFYFLLTGIITFLYFKTLSINKLSAILAALLISFSGYMVVGAGWGFSSHIFKAMFLLFAFEQLYLKKRWYFFPFAVIFLSSNVFVLFLYTVFLLLYSVFRYFSEKENTVWDYLKLAGKMVILGAVALLMNFAQVFKSFQKMFFSPRVAGNASYSNL